MSVVKLLGRTKIDAPEFPLSGLRSGDALNGGVSLGVIISGYSELVTPIQQVCKCFPNIEPIVLFPPNLQSAQLEKAVNGFLSIGEDTLRQNQLSDPVINASGFALYPPSHWR